MFTPCIVFALLPSVVVLANDNKDPFEPEILVQAKAIRVENEPDGSRQKVTFRIDHVYSGDGTLNGTTFERSFLLSSSGISNANLETEFAPPIKFGEIGIWYLRHIEGDLCVRIFNDGTHEENGLSGSSLAFPVPARRIVGHQDLYSFGAGNHIHYPTALKWAEIVEKVYKTSPAKRQELLRKYVFSDNPYVAAWSVRILYAYKPSDLIPSLAKWAGDFKLSVAAQVTIDEILSYIDRKNWLGSKKRMALLEHWVSDDVIDTHDVLMIAARIKQALELTGDEVETYQELDWKTWLPLMEKWIVQHHLTPGFENRLYRLYQSVKHPKDNSEDYIFSYSLQLLKTSKDPERQRFAAKWLYYLHDLSDAQLTTVKDMVKKTTNSEIRSLLEAAIKETERRRR